MIDRELGILLDQLFSVEGRERAIVGAVLAGAVSETKYIETALECLERNREYTDAARVAERMREYRRAALNYERAGAFADAARAARLYRNEPLAEMYERLAAVLAGDEPNKGACARGPPLRVSCVAGKSTAEAIHQGASPRPSAGAERPWQLARGRELRPTDVLKRVPGLQREPLLRWTKQGYLPARLETVEGRQTYLYPKSAVPMLQAVVTLVDEGYAPRKAFEKVRARR